MENTQKDALPKNHEFNLSDFALFLSVMKNKEAYQCVLSIIMDEANLELTEVKVELDEIVSEVKQSEEWEEVRMNIYEIGLENGEERLNRLYLILIDNKRYEDLEKAARDKEFRE